MLGVLLAALLLGAAAGAPGADRADFEAWKLEHGKSYETLAEESARFDAWEANRALVSRLKGLAGPHAGAEADPDSLRLDLNVFADVLPETFVRERCGLLPQAGARRSRSRGAAAALSEPVPLAVDWRTAGLVTKPKDQGACGSCWAFSAVAAIEGQHAKKRGSLTSLSEMNLVDCVHNETVSPVPVGPIHVPSILTHVHGVAGALAAGAVSRTARAAGTALGLRGGAPADETCCNGCSGGLMDVAYEYLLDRQAGGIDTEEAYAYTPRESRGGCHYTPSAVGAIIRGWVDVPVGDEEALLRAVATVGPISVGVDARLWQFYLGGTFPAFLCSSSPASMDHGVAIVGYGSTEAGKPYWIVKNSWGAGWGEGGYMRLYRGANACGVANAATYPLI